MTLADMKEASDAYRKGGIGAYRNKQEEILKRNYPTLVSRLAHFFDIPEEEIKAEIRQIVRNSAKERR